MPAPRVWIAQCLCPARHCIMAAAFDVSEKPAAAAIDELNQQIRTLLDARAINPWCGICRSSERHCEAAPTRFASMAEAWPELLRLQRENLAASRVLGEIPP